MPLNVIYIKFEYQLVLAPNLGGLKLFKIILQSKSFKYVKFFNWSTDVFYQKFTIQSIVRYEPPL